MQDLPSRFHRLKLVLASITLTVGGAALIAIGERTSDNEGLTGLIPWAEIGGIVIGAALLSIWIDHLMRSDQQAADDAASDREAFELLQFAIDGEAQKIRRSTRKNFQLYTVEVASQIDETNEPVTVSYTYRTLTKRLGHLLFFDIEQPTKDIKMTFDYTSTGIDHITAIVQMPSVRGTRTEHSPKRVTPQTVRVEVDGWTFPRSGVAFVWTLSSD